MQLLTHLIYLIASDIHGPKYIGSCLNLVVTGLTVQPTYGNDAAGPRDSVAFVKNVAEPAYPSSMCPHGLLSASGAPIQLPWAQRAISIQPYRNDWSAVIQQEFNKVRSMSCISCLDDQLSRVRRLAQVPGNIWEALVAIAERWQRHCIGIGVLTRL
jgi:hypothetical protein